MIRQCTRYFTVTAVLFAAARAFADPAPLNLSMDDAITRGLQANATIAMAGARLEEANASLERRQSVNLPRVRLETPAAYQTRNLKTQGMDFPNTPSVVGPFTSLDFRVYGDQILFDRQSYYNIKAGENDKTARANDVEDVRNQIIRQVAISYITAEYSAARVKTAESRVRTSEALETLAIGQKQAGVADGLDVLRARVQVANDRQNLLAAKNSYQRSLLLLARSIGMDMGTPLALTDTLSFKKLDPPHIDQAVTDALSSRPDYRSLIAQRESAQSHIRSSRSRYLPKVILSGNYGVGGQNAGDMEPTGMIQANLVMTMFDGDRGGEQHELESRLKRIEQQLVDQRRGVEQDIREALLNLESADEQVTVSVSGLELAERELQFARDRFTNGVVNNIEVVRAQDSLARANDNNLGAMAQHAQAKIALAAALGSADKTYRIFLGIQEADRRGSQP